ncbi:MAG: DEAD/DEAH box helicase [Theionarchaea archaeon]|nr:DEAD/DEAH box helicase [Theionarchaea archaeon]
MHPWIQDFLSKRGYNELLPSQTIGGVHEKIIVKKEKMLLNSPTSSGKTFLADMLVAYHARNLSNKTPIIYLVPYVAAAKQREVALHSIVPELTIVTAAKKVLKFEGIDDIECRRLYSEKIDQERSVDVIFDRWGINYRKKLQDLPTENFWKILVNLSESERITSEVDFKSYNELIRRKVPKRRWNDKILFRYRKLVFEKRDIDSFTDFEDFVKLLRILKSYKFVRETMLAHKCMEDYELRSKYFSRFLFNGDVGKAARLLSDNRLEETLRNIEFTDPFYVADLLIATPELLDKYLRKHDWFFKNTELLILDEVHILGDETRGGAYDKVVSWLRTITGDKIQILSMSATMGNPKEMAKWLGSKSVTSNYRPVKLVEGVLSLKSGHILWNDEEGNEFLSDLKSYWWRFKREKTVFYLCDMMRKMGGQTMVFTRSRKRCEALAKKYARRLSYEGKNNSLIYRNEDCWQFGVAFHNGSLTLSERETVEKMLETREIHTIFCTSTLAFGINIPARLVIIETHEMPMKGTLLKTSLAKQMVGRAGRYGLDRVGYALYLAKNDEEMNFIFSNYVSGKIEPIYSSFGQDKETHIASLIYNRRSFDSLWDILQKTFYYSDQEEELAIDLQKSLEILKIKGIVLEIKPREYDLSRMGKAMVKYFIKSRDAYSIITDFRNLFVDLQHKLVGLIEERGPPNGSNLHFFLSLLYSDIAEELSDLFAKCAEEISGNRLGYNDLKYLLKMRALGVEESTYRHFNLGTHDVELLFNNFDRYMTFLKESTELRSLIQIFERGVKTCVPYDLQWLLGTRKDFSYEKSIKLARNFINNEKIRRELGNPFTFPRQIPKNVKNYLYLIEKLNSIGFDKTKVDFLMNMDNETLNYYLSKVKDLSKLSCLERKIIESLYYKSIYS